MHITSLPMRWGTGDNYCYVVKDDTTKEAAVIDPAYPDEVLPKVHSLVSAGDIKLTSIVNTHHHYDHSGGNPVFHATFPQLPVYAGKDSPLVSKVLEEGATFRIGANVVAQALHTPCHTQDSICWFVTDEKTGQKALFSGDTLFICGCGRFFEGDANEMQAAMNKLGALPASTVVYPGHEYTSSNVKFAVQVEPKNPDLLALQRYCQENEVTTGKFTIGDELKYNPFLRTNVESVQARLGTSSAVATMAKLRAGKDRGKL